MPRAGLEPACACARWILSPEISANSYSWLQESVDFLLIFPDSHVRLFIRLPLVTAQNLYNLIDRFFLEYRVTTRRTRTASVLARVRRWQNRLIWH